MHEWRGLEPMQAADLVSQRDPREFPWGVFGSDDVSAAAGGVGVILRFGSRAELLDFTVEVEASVLLGADDPDYHGFQARLGSLRAKSHDPVVLSDGLRTEYNRAMQGVSEYLWWGHFSDLCEGQGEFARSLRSDIRETDGPESDRPITPGEVEQFVSYLVGYGH